MSVKTNIATDDRYVACDGDDCELAEYVPDGETTADVIEGLRIDGWHTGYRGTHYCPACVDQREFDK